MSKIEYSRVRDDDYRGRIVRLLRHDLAVKLHAAWLRVKENKRQNGGVYIPVKQGN